MLISSFLTDSSDDDEGDDAVVEVVFVGVVSDDCLVSVCADGEIALGCCCCCCCFEKYSDKSGEIIITSSSH